MNDNEAILVELRKISAWAELQRKMSRWALNFCCDLFSVIDPFQLCDDHEIKTTIAQVDAASWYDADRNVRSGDYAKALQIGEDLIKKTAQDPDAHRRLANAYLAAGKIDKSQGTLRRSRSSLSL